MKLIVTGMAGHGKDTVCEFLAWLGYKFQSSSRFVGELVVFPELSKKYGYKTFEECYADRDNHRKEWFDLIAAYNKDDLSRLGTELFQQYDIYCGLRNKEEFFALKEKFPDIATVWVNAERRKGITEGKASLTIEENMCDFVIYNNSDKNDLAFRVIKFATALKDNRLQKLKNEIPNKPYYI